MKIQELIERLQDIAEDFPDAVVMLATQPTYPIAETLHGVASPADDDLDDDGERDPSKPVVWLASGGTPSEDSGINPYAPDWVFQS